MSEFIDVYSKKTGEKHKIPAHFMDNPRLAAPWRKTPKQRAVDNQLNQPATGAASAAPTNTKTPATGDKED